MIQRLTTKKLILAIGLVIIFALGLILVLQPAELSPEEQQALVAEIIKTGQIERCAEAKGFIVDGIDYQTVCRNNIAFNLALSRLDLSSCSLLDDKLMSIEDCQQQVLLTKLAQENDLAVCDQAPTQALASSCQNAYWFQQAFEKQDISLCDKLTDSLAQTDCRDSNLIEQLILMPDDVSCNQFSEFLLFQNDCINFKEALEGDISGCDLIKDIRLQNTCRELTS